MRNTARAHVAALTAKWESVVGRSVIENPLPHAADFKAAVETTVATRPGLKDRFMDASEILGAKGDTYALWKDTVLGAVNSFQLIALEDVLKSKGFVSGNDAYSR